MKTRPRKTDILLTRTIAALAALLIALASACNQAHPEQNELLLTDFFSRLLTPAAVADPGDTTPPTIASAFPANGAAAVPTNTTLSITFSEAMLPSSVTANTTDTNCTLGSVQVSTSAAFGAGSCILMAGAPVASGGNKVFTLTPAANLAATTVHFIRVTTTVTDAAGNALATQFQQAAGFTTSAGADVTPPTVTSTNPLNAATAIAPGTSVSVTFSEAMNPTTLTTNTAGSACSGSFQVSSTAFASCVQMSVTPVASGGNTVFTITPTAALADLTTYQIRITTGVQDAAGNALAGVFTTAAGFTTADTTAPTVSSTVPANAATGVAVASTVAVTFNEAMNPATLTTNTAGTACSGTFQVSSDSFTTCVQMAAAPVPTVGNTVFTVTPSSALGSATTYRIRITTGAQDAAANALAAAFTTATGFTTVTVTKRVFVTALTYDGDLDTNNDTNAMPEADAFCMGDANYPATGTFKAMLVEGTNRRACTTANCSGGTAEHIDWVLKPTTAYVRAVGGLVIMTTNANGVFPFGTLTNSMGAGGATYWTGLAADWTVDAKICTGWTSNAGGANQGNKGLESSTSSLSVGGAGGLPQCNNTYTLLCVEQ